MASPIQLFVVKTLNPCIYLPLREPIIILTGDWVF